jgi:hypothetical protein
MYMKQTKPFTNMFGSEVQVSRAEFVDRWYKEAHKLGTLFAGTEHAQLFADVLEKTEYLAGLAWDSSK